MSDIGKVGGTASAAFDLSDDLLDHLAVVGRRAERAASKSMTTLGSRSSAWANSLTEISGRFGMLTLLSTSSGMRSLGRVAFEQVDQVLGIAQIGEVGRRRDHDLVGLEHDLLRPGGPEMRQVDGDVRHVLAHHVEHGIAGGGSRS